MVDRLAIIKYKNQGLSNRKISKMLRVERKTIAIYWKEYKNSLKESKKTILKGN